MGRRIRFIYLHHSASRSEQTSAADIDRWHRARGWRENGYHYIISRAEPGLVGRWWAVPGRAEDGDEWLTAEERGAHVGVPGYSNNSDSLGVCLCGYYHDDGSAHTEQPTEEALQLAVVVLAGLCARLGLNPLEAVRGHREAPGARTVCPGNLIDMDDIRARVAHFIAHGAHLGETI